MKTSTTIHVT